MFFILFIIISIVHLVFPQDHLSDCTHLLLPSLCQCYHSGDKSQLRCSNIQLESLPRLTINMQWNALDFSFNQLTLIDDYLFSKIYVEKLSLKFNAIETIQTTAFDQIENLQELDLSQNQLKEFDPRILISPGETLGKSSSIRNHFLIFLPLEIFDLSFNPLSYLNLGEIFLHLPVLRRFHAISCQLNDTSLDTLLKFTSHAFHSVQLIDLSSNQLTSLCKNLFDSFSHLVELRLNNNQISMIDNYLLYSLNSLKFVDLANNSLEILPNLFSSSLEYFNLSSNDLQYFDDYFLANLHSIRVIDFNSNERLHSISSRSFCFVNLTNLEKVSLRSTNLSSVQNFSEFFCRLSTQKQTRLLDLNDNMNLQCHCALIQYERYLLDYSQLTCTQQGQDRYFISNIAHTFSNCTWMINCYHENLCREWEIERLILDGTCYRKNQRDLIKPMTTMMSNFEWENSTENSTRWNETFNGVSMNRFDLKYFFIGLFLTFLQ